MKTTNLRKINLLLNKLTSEELEILEKKIPEKKCCRVIVDMWALEIERDFVNLGKFARKVRWKQQKKGQ